ncbi:hypothetical protein ETAE_1785 [Edwardsiella piscicida]|uniref:Uncharacterized protein n=2 Tax=Edwardsiella TaxID=635 RepID=A0A0H3DSY1_EDWTF|nr:hypothetical protein ETAE_1785 [Edwardsiella tarda EIB202]ADM41722.1 hypothetical protein ETAF_1614 [Edwardsiella tarda FL6-60]
MQIFIGGGARRRKFHRLLFCDSVRSNRLNSGMATALRGDAA